MCIFHYESLFARWHLLHWDILLLKKATLISVCIILFARETLDSSLYDVILFACQTPWLTLDSSLYDLILFACQTPWLQSEICACYVPVMCLFARETHWGHTTFNLCSSFTAEQDTEIRGTFTMKPHPLNQRWVFVGCLNTNWLHMISRNLGSVWKLAFRAIVQESLGVSW